MTHASSNIYPPCITSAFHLFRVHAQPSTTISRQIFDLVIYIIHTFSFEDSARECEEFFYVNQFISTSIHYFNFVSLDDVAIRHATNAIQWMAKKDVTSDLTIKLLISFSTSPQFFTLELLPFLHFIRAVCFFSSRFILTER